MKYKIIITSLIIFCFSCSKSDPEINLSETPDILGEWRLTQVLVDPGDGSGVYEDYTGDDHIINFLPNGTVFSNYSVCDGTSATSSVPYYAAQDLIKPPCYAVGYYISYYLEDGKLILAGPCIEPCLSKYERIQ